jgi:hypothetical protein
MVALEIAMILFGCGLGVFMLYALPSSWMWLVLPYLLLTSVAIAVWGPTRWP